jgi:hypothetical protein
MGISAKAFGLEMQVYGQYFEGLALNYRQYEKVPRVFGS